MLWGVNEYSLELARRGDAARLAVMSNELVEYGFRPSWSASRISCHIRHPDSLVLCARDADGVIAGFAIMRYARDTAHLNLLAVDPAHRRRGVARHLIRWLEETAFTAGTFIIGLELRATNEGAFAFYQSIGYRELDRVEGYYQGLETAIRMTRDLRAGSGAVPGTTESPPEPI
jgi:ribosomal-protein-alanine N-acetyltransferase